jgi:hypothetical protein
MNDIPAVAAIERALKDADRYIERQLCDEDEAGPVREQITSALTLLHKMPTAPSGARGEETKLAQAALERDRSRVAECLSAIKVAIERRRWLTQAGRGSYAYDDARYQREFGAAIEDLEIAIAPLNDIAHDWSNCPKTQAEVTAARASRPAPQAQRRGSFTEAMSGHGSFTAAMTEHQHSAPQAQVSGEPEWNPAVMDALSDSKLRRCNICGFIVDTSYEATKPTVDFSTAGRGKKAALAVTARRVGREEIARKIDPLAFDTPEYGFGSLNVPERKREAFAKADRILALISGEREGKT